MFKTLLVGIDGEKTVNSKTTQEQLDELHKYELDLEHQGEKISWEDIDNIEESRTFLQSILNDRKMRVDNHTLMADRPSFAVATIYQDRIVRIEYYEGHDALKKVYDLRSKELQDKEMPDFMTSDPQAYDPAEFLEEAFGIPREISEPILKEIHKEDHRH